MTATPPALVYIGLGANLPHRAATIAGERSAPDTLRAALSALGIVPGVALTRVSSLYRSAPLDASGPDYFNAVAELRTTLAPLALFDQLQRLEQQFGRQRPYRNAPRTLDLDLLWYDDQRIETATLTVPHPRMPTRAFVLVPLAELAPDLRLKTHADGPIDGHERDPLRDRLVDETVSDRIAAVADQVISRIGPIDAMLPGP